MRVNLHNLLSRSLIVPSATAAAPAAAAGAAAAPVPTIANPEEEQRSVPTIQSKQISYRPTHRSSILCV